ncbi:hypothetical protein N1851_006483 [Merluccius polli]|uniref:Uncharacterized protein n=1 Tax=Merluccius polli TaxID=89951 RepID=A0AA47P9C9_MERPO|nr:hypothetical protein N1851_006483 [Merluccius polli]
MGLRSLSQYVYSEEYGYNVVTTPRNPEADYTLDLQAGKGKRGGRGDDESSGKEACGGAWCISRKGELWRGLGRAAPAPARGQQLKQVVSGVRGVFGDVGSSAEVARAGVAVVFAVQDRLTEICMPRKRPCLCRVGPPDASVSFLLRRQQKRIHRGCRGGLRDRLRLAPHKTALPSIFLANVRSLVNKMDELRLRITTNKRIMDCNLLIFTETWLNPSVPDNAINLAERNIFRADRTADSGKSKGGGLCIYVNNAWCTNSSIIESHCSENAEYLMYSPLIRRVKPTVRTVKIWPEGAEAKLQECFQNHDWSKHSSEATLDSHTDITLYTSTDSVTTLKRITTFPNQKPWMNREVRALLKAHDIAFRSGDRRAYSSSRANLKRGITEAKHNHKLRIEEHFMNDSDPRRMWQGIQAITDCKTAHITPQSSDASLPEELGQGGFLVWKNPDPFVDCDHVYTVLDV